MKVLIVGGGVSGVMAAIKASKNNEVTIIEKNDKLLKKLLLTGNGRCNFWNSVIDSSKFVSTNMELVNDLLKDNNKVFNYLLELGIYPKCINNNYYPNSLQAASVREIFVRKINELNINVKTNEEVIEYKKIDNKFIIKTTLNQYECDKLIFSFGSFSYPKCGTDGKSFNIINNNVNINNFYPSLVPLKLDFKYLKLWENVRCNCSVSLYSSNDLIDTELGECQFTSYGISGINIFNLSSHVNMLIDNKKDVYININFLPEINDVFKFLNDRSSLNTLENILETVLPYQLINVILKCSNIDKNVNISSLTKNEILTLVNNLSSMTIKVIGTLSYDRSQVTRGGVSLLDINLDTFECKNKKNLYFTGEMLDITGKCGGYNLMIAFISGFKAGESCND